MQISISSAVLVRTPELIVVTRLISGVTVQETPPSLQQKKKDEILKKWQGSSITDLDSIPEILIYRSLQEKLQPGAKEQLPAVEGLLTRSIFKGKFPTINSAVDTGNIISLTHLLPIGFFDAGKIVGNMTLDLASGSDSILLIGKDKPGPIPVDTPILRDTEKVFSLIGARDSKDTMITTETKNILAFTWALGEEKRELLGKALEECEARLTEQS